MTLLITLIIAAITYGTPLLFGTLGEILTEKSGNLNLGVEGIMFMGGALGLGGVYYYEKLSSSPNGFVAILVGIFFAFLAGAIASLIFSFLTITLRANQNVTGLALSIFGTGIGQFIGEYMRVSENGYISVSNMLKGYFQNSPFPKGLQDIPVVGGILFGNSFFFYLAVACDGERDLFFLRRLCFLDYLHRFLCHLSGIHIGKGRGRKANRHQQGQNCAGDNNSQPFKHLFQSLPPFLLPPKRCLQRSGTSHFPPECCPAEPAVRARPFWCYGWHG